MVIDYSHGLTADTLTQVLNRLAVDVVPLNARMDETKLAMLHELFENNRRRTAAIVDVLGADLGIQFDVGGERIFIIDEHGNSLNDVTAAALMVELALTLEPGRPVAVPVTMPNAFEEIAHRHGSELIRTVLNLSDVLQVIEDRHPALIVDGHGGYIMADFLPFVDGMMASMKLLEYLARRDQPISAVVGELPEYHIYEQSVDCPTNDKGMVMRKFNERFTDVHMDKTDGVKIWLENGEWLHFKPDPEMPVCNVTAEAHSEERAKELVLTCTEDVRRMIMEEA